ncbi:hypothetical protein MPSEU_000082200 [Mayamaea pseudoterrestris]|nr:hypothetical protein MPSEU_000082200 [Mayamaea pseudoterrestris]
MLASVRNRIAQGDLLGTRSINIGSSAPSAAPSNSGGQWPSIMMAPPSIANDGGDFYDQIHSEIKDLRSRVDVRLRDVVSNGENELDFLTEQLDALKRLETEEGMINFAAEMEARNDFSNKILVAESPLDDASEGGKSFDDLQISSSAATEPANNRRQIAMARRLHKINFPDEDTIAESDAETEESSKSDYVFQNSMIMDKPQAARKNDAVTKARELASPKFRHFFPDKETDNRISNKATMKSLVDTPSESSAIVPVAITRSPYASQMRASVQPTIYNRQQSKGQVGDSRPNMSQIRNLSQHVPSLLDGLESPRSPQVTREREPPDTEVVRRRAIVPDPSGVDNQLAISPSRSGRYLQRSDISAQKNTGHRDSQLDEFMSSLDYLDKQHQASSAATPQISPHPSHTPSVKSSESVENRIVAIDSSDLYSTAMSSALSVAQSVASQSCAYKAMNLESLAHSSVTDSMALHSETDIFAKIAAGKTNGVVRIEKVQGRALCDPYGDRGRYTGILVKGKPYGHGTMHYDDGRSYTGDWKNGRWQGKGRTLFVNGDFYVGKYVKDQRHGLGRYEWSDGRVYDGQFIKDRREGKGTYTWPDGAIYAGDFNAGHRHGQGCYKFPDGSVYTGEFKEGKYHGVGECIWADGRWYRGEWAEGHAHGYGVEVRPDGTIRHDGEWKSDRPVRNGKELKERNIQDNTRRKNKIPEGDRPKRRSAHPPSPGMKSKFIYQIDP